MTRRLWYDCAMPDVLATLAIVVLLVAMIAGLRYLP